MNASGGWPEVPAELKYVEFRIPGTFRELAANRNFSDAEIGKIVRCLALDSDYFLTPKIEPEVFYYRRNLIKKNQTRKRVEAHRLRARGENGGCVEKPVLSVTVTHGAENGVKEPVEVTLSNEKTPPCPKEKTPPIVPLEKKTPVPLEKKRTRKEAVASGIQQDLFAMFVENGKEAGLEASTGVRSPGNDTGQVQDIGNDSRPAGELPGDSRVDAAWIPKHFAVFWERYPRKVAKSDASRAFSKIIKKQPDVDRFMSTLMASLEWWKSQPSWTKDGGKFIPYPATWLNRGNWGDSMENQPQGGGAQFLRGNDESDEELIRRMQGG